MEVKKRKLLIFSIRYLPFYNKNTYISTTSADGTCNIWSTEHSNPIVVYSGHSGSVNQVKFHPTSQLASTVSGDGSIHLWKFSLKHQDENEEEKPEKTEEEENEGTTNINVCQKKLNLDTIILDMDWSSDGSLITTGGWDNQVRLLNLSNEQLTPTQIFKGHEAPINTIQISAQNNLILSASRDSTIRIWDPRVLENVTSIKAHSGVVSSAIWAQNDKFIITGGEDGNLKYWDAKNMKTPIKTCFLQGAINKMSLSSYHSRICIGMASKRSKIYDMSGQVLAQFPKAHNLMITDCTWSPDGSNIFTCSIDKTAKQWLYLTDQN